MEGIIGVIAQLFGTPGVANAFLTVISVGFVASIIAVYHKYVIRPMKDTQKEAMKNITHHCSLTSGELGRRLGSVEEKVTDIQTCLAKNTTDTAWIKRLLNREFNGGNKRRKSDD
jgi:Fe-S cluster assembly ATPase SufC